MQLQLLYRGAKIDVGVTYVESNDDKIVYLKKDDKLHVRFHTYGTTNMNTNTILEKNESYIRFWKL